ncbi:MAG: flagellar protein FlaG [Nitrospirota bacterium]
MKINNINNYTSSHVTNNPKSETEKKGKGFSLSLSVNGQSGQVAVKVIDNKSKETIRETTSQELRDVYDKLRDMAGRLFDKKA